MKTVKKKTEFLSKKLMKILRKNFVRLRGENVWEIVY